jgi:hypothetical protein
MSWSEFKKKKEQDEYEKSISSSRSKSIDKTAETETISSWQKFKEEKENKDKQSSYKNSENKKEDKKTILDDIGYTAKSLGTGIIGGLTGLAKAGTTEIQNELQKGADEKKSVLDNIKDIIGVTQKISNPLSTLPKTAIDNFISAINTFADNDSTPFEKIINHVNNSVTSALDTALPFKGAIDETIQMIGSLNPNAKDKIKNIDEKISTPYNNLQKSLSEESRKYNSITQMAGNVANVAGNMVPSIAATAITKNPSIGLVTMGISAKGQATQEALDKGADLDKAVKIGNTKGMIEIGTEMLSGGVNIFGKGALDDIVEKGLISKVKNKVGKVLAKEGYDFAGEVGEEVISDVLGTLIDKGTVDSNAKYTISDFGDTAITTILSTAVLKAIGIPLNKLNNQNLKTENEQKVYDNELGTRISEKTKESTIDNAYNKQLDIKKNLGIEITDDVKKETMQKVKNAYENGTLNVTELSKQEKDKIQKQLDIDFEDGNISTDKIKQILGENIDLSNDKYLMKSMYENEQKFNTYEVTKTNNEKVDILLQSAADAGMNNTTKTRRKIELISKLVADTNKQYKFVSPEQLKQLGYNENANGLIDKSTGNILINVHSDNGIQSIIGHETTHIFDGKNENGEYSKEYQTLQDMAIEYAKTKGIYDSKIKNITDSYGDLLADESQIKEELTADLVGDFLFNDEHFIENLAVKNKNIFQKIYDYVKHAYKMITSKTDEAKALENLKYQFDKVYNSVFETNDTETQYSIAGKQGMLNAIKSDTQNLELERNYNKAQQMQENGIDNETIRQNTGWFQDRNGDWKFEFTDRYMSLKNINFKENKTYKLGDILEHDILFTAYPELADYNVKFEKMDTSGAFRKTENLIRINTNKLNAKNSKVAIEGTMIHEIQHAIQSIEGFEEGKGSRFKLAYYESLGEIEADNTKKRYILEKNGKLDRNSVKPESSKNNPQHSNLNNYLKNRKLLDKIKDSVYNYYNNKYKKSGDSYEIYQKDLEQNNHENSSLGFERTNRNRRSDGTLGNRGNENRKNGRKNGEKIQEANPQLQIQSEKIRKATYKNKEKNNIKVWNDGILEESESNSGSFYNDKNKKYSLKNNTTITGDDIAVKDMLKQSKTTLDGEVGNTKQYNQSSTITVEDMLNQTPEEKQQRMKDKAEKYLSRSKTKFINKIVNDFGTSKIANTKTLNSVVNSIREDIQRNGTLTNEKRTSYFNNLYDNLIKIDTQYYDTYKEVKENILNTKLYVSDAIRNNITDYNDFRKNHIGSIIMTNDKSNISVDSYYQELSDSYPELFPTDIINPADQLQRIADVSKDIAKVETNVAAYNDKYLGKDYRTWAKMEFDKDIDTFTNNIKLAERYNNESNEKQKLNIDKESIKNVYKQLPDARRNYEKVSSKELLTKEDRVQVDRLLNNEISIQEIPKGLNTEGIIKVAESKMEYDSLQKAIKEYQTEIKKARIEEARNDIGNLDLWKDKNIGFKYSRETPIRNIYDVAPKDIADNIVNKYFRSYIEVNEKKVVDSINEYNERIRKLDIGTKKEYIISYTENQNGVEVTIGPQKVSESALVQLLGEKKITPDALYSTGVDVTKIEKAVDEFRNIYEELIEQINESMLDNGYAPVEHRKDYFPHFTEEKADTLLGKAAKLLGIDITNREELPTDIAGQTYQFKPGRTWFSNILERTSNVTDYDALKGFDKYIRGATDLIYHTGDIQNLRALSTAIKGNYNDVEIQNRIEEIKESSMSDIEKADAIQEIYNVAKDKSHLSKFIEWLDNYTNLLAGKKAINDRGAEKELNRQVYKTMQDVESRIAANAIGGNVGVSLTNFAVISQAWGEVRTSNLINGVWQTMKASLGKDSSFASESQFITRRKGADTLIETTLDKVTKPINAVLNFADNFSSEVIVRAKYNQNLQEGMNTEQALQEADRYTASLMADRGRGALPTQFSNKNPIAKMMNMFQVEVNNQWSYYFKDLPRNIQQKANGNKAEIVANTAMAYTKIMVGAYLTNELLGSIRGNSTRVLPDPIYIVKELLNRLTDDDDDNDDDAIIGTLTEIAGNLPFISLPATLLADSLGLDVADIGRISISGAIPNVANIISDTSDMIHGSKTIGEGAKSIGSELLDTVGASLVLPYGGSQLKKTAKGLAMYLNDVPGSYTKNGDLRYTVDDNLLRKVQAGIFGAYANPYAQDYTDSGYKAIDQDDVAEMLDLNMNSSEYRKYKSGLSKAQKTVDKNGYKQYNDDSGNIYWYDSKKGIMYDNSYKKTNLTKDDLTKSVKTQEALNYINSLDLTNSQKNIAANDLTKNSKKTIDMKEYGKYSSYEEYKYARDYPEKYGIITQITDYGTYLKYKEDISDIKKKYKIETEHDSNLRKKAIRNYINNLDLNKTQKILLEKMAGGYGITNYKGTIHNYLDTTNLSQDEKYKIWKELFD